MNYLKVLGCSGSKSKNLGTTCFQISNTILIDTGNVINAIGDEALEIEHIFLTHSHSDHIADLPYLLDSFYEIREIPLNIYASKETINSLKKHLFNDEIWPDFNKISLINKKSNSIIYHEINCGERITLDDYTIEAFNANHVEGSFGFVISKINSSSCVISGDSFINPKLVEIINDNQNITDLLIDCSFPNKLNELAKLSLHLTPQYLKEQLKDIRNKNLNIYIYHIKHLYLNEIEKELNEIKQFKSNGKILNDGDIIYVEKQ